MEENPYRLVLEPGHSMGAKKKKKKCAQPAMLWLWAKQVCKRA